jgi:transposase-like protein/IS1 family transposase
MTCPKCQHEKPKRFGTYGKAKTQRYRCRDCGATFTEPTQKPLGRHYTSVDAASKAVALLCEGMSIRAVSRLTGLHKNTLLRLLLTIGAKCERLLDQRIVGLKSRNVQADELWTTVGKRLRKDGRKRVLTNPTHGDQYVWFALDSDTKLIISQYVGKRNTPSAEAFIDDLSQRVPERLQLTTDGFDSYADAVSTFMPFADYAQLVKLYQKGRGSGPDWYGPANYVRNIPTPLRGDPDLKKISTSFVERLNLTARMHCRRLTRLTNAYSKSLRHLKAAIALLVAWYNFVRVHQTLRVTPAMQAGLTDHVWSINELLATQI